MEWVKEFLNLFFTGRRDEAYSLKQQNIPLRLYKYQPLDEKRLNSLLNNEIWFSTPNSLNDPFDCRGIYWDENELHSFLKEKIPIGKFNEFKSSNEIVAGAIESARQHTRIVCFSEELYCMPMWAHYAQNHSGICVEYNFAELDHYNEFSKSIFPVGYQSDRYDITNLFKITINDYLDPRIYLLFFLMQIKHSSWGYEKEWRIINETETGEGGLVKLPIKPMAVYMGLKCENSELRNRLEKEMDCPIFFLKETNNKFFHFDKVCIHK